MDCRQNCFISAKDSLLRPAHIKKPTTRSMSLFSVSKHCEGKYAETNFNTKNIYSLPVYNDTVHSNKTSSRRHSYFVQRYENSKDYNNVLREKVLNNEPYDYNEPWLCEVDIFHEKFKACQLFGGNNCEKYMRPPRFSESEKDTNLALKDSYNRRIRTRSESEPNSFRDIKYSVFQNERYIEKEDNIRHLSNGGDQVQISKNDSPKEKSSLVTPEVSVVPTYNLYFPDSNKKPVRFRSSSTNNSPHLNRFRKYKRKSRSPVSKRKPLGSLSPFRKSRSATPSRHITLKRDDVIKRISYDSFDIEIKKPNWKHLRNDDYGEDEDIDEEFSSESDNDYKSHASTRHSQQSALSDLLFSAEITVPDKLKSPFISSLFPHVPPYIVFSSYTEKGPPMPPEVHRILKWKLTSVMPKVVRHIVLNSGFRLLKKTNDWMGTWGKHMKSPCFKAIRSYQKINHLPGSFKLGRKDSCWKNLQKHMGKYGRKEFGFMPRTYIIPQDLKALRKAWPKYAQRNFKWIIKPPASARGTGIKVINRWAQIPKRKAVIVQRYIEKPLLINGSKFDIRLYVLVTSINPLRVYMYHDGLARFASVKYSNRPDTLNDRCMHLTNYSINKLNSNYHKNEDVNACHGHKWTLKSLWSHLASRGINTTRLWASLRNLVLRTILAGENAIYTMIKLNVESRYSCFELFGFDVLLDSELIPWLLEVNISPSLHSELPLDLHVKAPLVQAVLNTALYNVPPKLSIEEQKEILSKHGLKGPLCYDKRIYITYLSRAEKLKHSQFTRKDLEYRDQYLDGILQNLTPDDVRCLIVSEDEFSRCSPLERIFPTENTYKYHKYMEHPRYYNCLLDAWEHRYGKNREAGIALLREFCEQKYHLEVPPAPIKRILKNRTQTLRSVPVRRRRRTGGIALRRLTVKSSIKTKKRRNKKSLLVKQLRTKTKSMPTITCLNVM